MLAETGRNLKDLNISVEPEYMGAPKYLEKREHTRKEVAGEPLPGRLTVMSNNRALKVRLMDVSIRGLGVVVDWNLKPGEGLKLFLGDQEFHLEVVFSEPYLGIDNLYRCGLFARDENANLEQVLDSLMP